MEARLNSPFSLIDADLTKHILSYLTQNKDLRAASQVNKEWFFLVKEIFNEMRNPIFSKALPCFLNQDSSEMTMLDLTHLGEFSLANNPTYAVENIPRQDTTIIKTPTGKSIQLNYTITQISIGATSKASIAFPPPASLAPQLLSDKQRRAALEEYNATPELHLFIKLLNIISRQEIPLGDPFVPHNTDIAIVIHNSYQSLPLKVMTVVKNAQGADNFSCRKIQPRIILTPNGELIANLNPRESKVMMIFRAQFSDSPLKLIFLARPNINIPHSRHFTELTLTVLPPLIDDDENDKLGEDQESEEVDSIEEEAFMAENPAERVQKAGEENEPIENSDSPEKEKGADDAEKEGKEKEQDI